MLLFSVLPSIASDADVWSHSPPGKPHNVTINVTETGAVVSWQHAPPDEGGLAIHYTLKWQEKDQEDATWYPGWVGIGDERAAITDLVGGVTYACRIAAINKSGRTWSDYVIFSTLSSMRCDETWHWPGAWH